MSAVATPGLSRAIRFYEAPIGKKAVMAVTGIILFGFVLGHLIGNLQIYLGPEKINAYGELLRANMALLWFVRLALLLVVVLHIVSSLQLTKMKLDARPVGYVKYTPTTSSVASRTMIWTGVMVAAFVVYHLLHFTFGSVHPNFEHLAVYSNVVYGFRRWPVSFFYILAMVLLGLHLQHGLWSMFQSLGISHPRYTPFLKQFAIVFSVLIVVGNISIPIAVMLGLLGSELP
jgi:succinate dehydrogenase / fumarate reductase cytochrome b subunit